MARAKKILRELSIESDHETVEEPSQTPATIELKPDSPAITTTPIEPQISEEPPAKKPRKQQSTPTAPKSAPVKIPAKPKRPARPRFNEDEYRRQIQAEVIANHKAELAKEEALERRMAALVDSRIRAVSQRRPARQAPVTSQYATDDEGEEEYDDEPETDIKFWKYKGQDQPNQLYSKIFPN